MSRSLAELKAELSPQMRARVDARAKEIMAEIDGLRPLRTALDRTQEELAQRLQISQASVAKMEQRTDMLLSTLNHYVEALGGRLSLVASFPGRPEVRISKLGDIPEPEARNRPKRASGRRAGKIAVA
jgi:transcriptional regulator with XRE-family HTH domain